MLYQQVRRNYPDIDYQRCFTGLANQALTIRTQINLTYWQRVAQ